MPAMVSGSRDDGPPDDLITRYHDDGYVVVRGVVDGALAAHAGRHADWLLERHPGVRGEELGHRFSADDPCWSSIVSDTRLVDLAARFVGPDVALFASHYISKPAHDGRPVLWHQDAACWPLDPMQVVTPWLAVDPSTVDDAAISSASSATRASSTSTKPPP
jgi:ectoine hydroxylase-related dioxygenase (phytanoyl-CoA dioxygenase family)